MPENLFPAAALTGNAAFSRPRAPLSARPRTLRSARPRRRSLPRPARLFARHRALLRRPRRGWSSATPNTSTPSSTPSHLLTTQQQFASGGWGPNETFITPHRGELYARSPPPSTTSRRPAAPTPPPSSRATSSASRPRPPTRAMPTTWSASSSTPSSPSSRPTPTATIPTTPPTRPSPQSLLSKKWPCCSGTLAQTVADYPLNLYFHVRRRPLRQCSTRRRACASPTPARPSSSTQETRYPAEDTTTLTLQPASPPASRSTCASPRGSPNPPSSAQRQAAAAPRASRHLCCIRRTWRAGDRIELTLPQSFRTEPIDDLHPETVALMRGPVQYVPSTPQPNSAATASRLPAGLKQIGPQSFVENYSGNADRLRSAAPDPERNLHHLLHQSLTKFC